jgi:predicted AAA+ superfamily ATPase
MLFRKIQAQIEKHLISASNKVLVVEGARQIGKSYIIRHVGKKNYANYVEINMLEDSLSSRFFERVRTVEDFYLQLSATHGAKLGSKSDTIVFIDEIQAYPHLLTLLKFLQQDGRYTYIASGSLLGVSLAKTVSIPIGSIEVIRMYPLDFEEFLLAYGVGRDVIDVMRDRFKAKQSLEEPLHDKLLALFKRYLLSGGLPDAVNTFVETQNIELVRNIHREIHQYYGMDAAQYDLENNLKIKALFDYIPSALENTKRRIVVQNIENKKGKRFSDYKDEIDYVINAGIALDVRAISNPKFPLLESLKKNLIKLYLNDVGLLTNILYDKNIRAVLDDMPEINLGIVYESVVAQELRAHGYTLSYYDNKQHGEVDFLVDDYNLLSVVPIEVKSGKDYKVHSALSHFLSTPDYHIKQGYVLSNERKVEVVNNIIYMPIYNIMFFNRTTENQSMIIPKI